MDTNMDTNSEPNSQPTLAQAADHVAGAHQSLKALQEKLGEHPEIGSAILKLEMALNLLAVKTGGVL